MPITHGLYVGMYSKNEKIRINLQKCLKNKYATDAEYRKTVSDRSKERYRRLKEKAHLEKYGSMEGFVIRERHKKIHNEVVI